jgi:ABC-type glycerol-3-phosphate transport system substrate-binding protein
VNKRLWQRIIPVILLISALTAGVQAQTTDQAPPTPTLSPVMAPSPESTAAENPAIQLRLWWVDTLAPLEGESSSLRAGQLRAITESLTGVEAEVRIKLADGPGSLRESLLAADAVAPGALPDLALIPRRDLPFLISVGLAQPLDNVISNAELERFYPAGVVSGDVNGRLYGLPYALDLQHLAYQPPTTDFTTFESSLSAGRSLLLPLAGTALNPTVLAQYLSSGGVLTDGLLTQLDEVPLRTLLNYYAQAVASGLLDSRSSQYTTLTESLPALLDGSASAGLVNTAGYLSLRSEQLGWVASANPLANLTPITLVESWLWVILSTEPLRQDAAWSVITGLMSDERLAAYTAMVGVLPATPAALLRWPDRRYATFAGELLTQALPAPTETGELAATRLMNAVRQVVNGDSVEEAIAAALADG